MEDAIVQGQTGREAIRGEEKQENPNGNDITCTFGSDDINRGIYSVRNHEAGHGGGGGANGGR